MNRLYSWRFWIAATTLFTIFSLHLKAQGSSDTGVGAMPVFKPVKEIFTSGKNNIMGFGLSAGAADYSILVLTPEISYSHLLGKHFSLDSRITAAWHTGNEASTAGFGDVFANLNYLPFSNFAISAGLKLRLNSAGKFYTDEIVYPMDYQSSLGTIDFYTGLAYHPGRWHFALVWQHPFVQNDNWFYPDPTGHPDSPFNKFPGTFGFIRKDDILLQLARTIKLNEKISIAPGLSTISHLAEDELPEANDDGYMLVSGSKGFTINVTALASVHLNESSFLEFNLGFPLVERDVQLEGLSRSFCFGGEYLISF